MSDSALKLSHIFWEAGAAFGKLSELTRDFHNMNDSQSSCKWNEEEVEMLRACVHRFALDLHQLSVHIKNKTIEQIKRTLRKKAFEDAGIPLREASGPPEPPSASCTESSDVSSDPESWTGTTEEEASS
ncbi:chromatin complexes subunit BAP18 [Papilio machaon]|uniref:chromatin complexes subunit BAP18 n=1 Tax=Papilio machaon TaxID=76193 RepID=UPI0006EAD542|nr:chromatin complexes subunit BAP18 [Papilio machaon]XP_014364751.1 chromatin complexes subunit BAP18 [Papilio machaon]XP_014364752.1 chromatin complexes subunit BAP18 [Papilio machaon]